MQKDVEPTDAAHEAVRRPAYESYEQRGREDGHDWDDWIAAERELRGSAVAQGIEVQAEDARANAGRRRPAKPPSGARSELAQGLIPRKKPARKRGRGFEPGCRSVRRAATAGPP